MRERLQLAEASTVSSKSQPVIGQVEPPELCAATAILDARALHVLYRYGVLTQK